MPHRVFIGLGANLDQPSLQLETALAALARLPSTELVQSSAFYVSFPLGPQDQPDYLNAVCELRTALAPQSLLRALQAIELQQGRVKKRHWGERVIDLDILLYDDLQLQTDKLQIPHPQLHLRDFVLIPLAQIAPTLQIPGLGSLKSLIATLQQSYLKPL
ncbi:MAG: 2-amino-4-hydroxy-6-hydroxymethyldihydropteridine diphosphokinase [Thiotrichales bacterium]|nr:2-amino-4-hydroxy-6-hydroxymethyldihydropteridine diphosphokinase [Thiotrichales bacterium]